MRKIEHPVITERVALPVIPEPDPGTATVFHRHGEGTLVFTANDNSIAMVCGNCAAELTAGLDRGKVRGAVLRCNNCAVFNQV